MKIMRFFIKITQKRDLRWGDIMAHKIFSPKMTKCHTADSCSIYPKYQETPIKRSIYATARFGPKSLLFS